MDVRRPVTRRLLIALLLVATGSPGCLVLSLQPAYDDESIAWNEALLGTWHDAEDNVEVTVERGQWRSYRIHYKHPIEEADFTGRLTAIGNAYFLDLMPSRGVDYGAVLIPSHLVLRLEQSGAAWLVSALDYDPIRAALKSGRLVPRDATFDQRQNVILTGSTTALRDWLRSRTEADFTAPATFERMNP